MIKKYIVIDDNQMIINLIKSKFNSNKVKVFGFNYGEECLNELKNNIDLVILDYHFIKVDIEVMNGLDIVRIIKDFNEKTPIIMLSNQEKGNVVLELAREGIDDYVIKDKYMIENLEIAIDNIFSS